MSEAWRDELQQRAAPAPKEPQALLAEKVAEYEKHRQAVNDLKARGKSVDDLSVDEKKSVVEHGEAAGKLYDEIVDETRDLQVRSVQARLTEALGGDGSGQPGSRDLGMYSLVPSDEQLLKMRTAIRDGQGSRLRTDRLPRNLMTRAAVTLSLTGGRVGTSTGRLPEPRRLVTSVGLVPIPSTTAGTSGPKFGATAATAATAEGAAKPEAATVTKLDIGIKQLARWTTLSRMALLSQENMLADVVAWHAIAIAKDEDKLLVDAINALAGTAIAFSGTDQRAPVRAAMAKVEDAVSAPCDAVICHPDNYGLLAGFDPTDANEAGGRVVTFGNGILYPTSSCPTGFVLVAAVRAAGRFIVADPTSVATVEALSTNETTVRTEELVGFDMALVGSAAKIDVVTP